MKDNQIISIKSSSGIMGMFDRIEFSLQGLLSSSDKLIGTKFMLPIQHDDNYTVQPVRVFEQGVYSYSVEEGIVTDCQHVVTENDGEPYNYCMRCGEVVEKSGEEDFDCSDEYRELEGDRRL